jgi:arginyl-tRNA--protein-N-Asp/Glu arginylyltransferase
MFIRQQQQPLRVFRTTPAMRCPYLPFRLEVKLVTELGGPDALDFNDRLTEAGFRRSHRFLYKPLCEACSACVPVRIPTADFQPTRTQRRLQRTNARLIASVAQPVATAEQFELFTRYVQTRHGDGDMASMEFDDFRSMIEDTSVDTYLVEFRDPEAGGKLVGAALTDWLGTGVSAVYSFFDPDQPRRGFGTWAVLWMVEEARRRGLSHVYLGYWIREARKMAYKRQFRPLEALGPGGWKPLPDA